MENVNKNVSEMKNNDDKSDKILDGKMLYASVVRKSNKLPVIIKPIEKSLNSTVTIEDIKNNIIFNCCFVFLLDTDS